MKVTKVIVVPHVHWDREWYFTCEESQVLAVRDFTEALDYLESHPDYPSYMLDGQMAVVDEYMETVPGSRERVRKLVEEGRLLVGPWYTQTDEMVVGAEPIVRNLLYGMESASALGDPMLVGYVPDSFGQSAAMPQILNEFGIERSVFWRGQSQFSGTDSNQFWWTSRDGSRVLVNQLPLGYATGKYLETDPEKLKARYQRLFSLWDEISATPYAILPNGHDQMPIQTNIDEALEALRTAFPDREFVLGSLDDELDLVEASAKKNPLPEISSEFLDGKRERVHRSIFSVRMDNKVANVRAENILSRRVEPLLAVMDAIDMSQPRSLVMQAWKPLLENHAHDSIGGCCSDKVNAEVAARAAASIERSELLEHYGMRYVTEAADLPFAGKLGMFSMTPVPGTRTVRAEVLTQGDSFELIDADGATVPYDVIDVREVDPGLIDRQIVAAGHYDPFLCTTVEFEREFAGVGYEVLGVREVEGERPTAPSPQPLTNFDCGCYHVSVNGNGTIDLSTDGGASYHGILGLEIEGNDGDEYDFSAVRGGRKIYSSDVAGCVPTVTRHASTVEVELSYAVEMPAGIDGWTCDDAPTVELGVNMHLTFDRLSPVIGVAVALDNQADDYRVRLLVPTGIAAKSAVASNQFGSIERPVVDPALVVWEEEGWSERPDAIYPFLDYVALSDDANTVAVLTNGAREYEVIGDAHDTLAVTLLSGVGTLGKPDLLRRPGRPSGISVETPDAQCHGAIRLELGLVLLDSPVAEARLGSISAGWLAPVTTHQRFDYAPIHVSDPYHPVPARFALVSQGNASLVPSSVKVAENGSGIVARFYNETCVPQELDLVGAGIAERLTLAEVPCEGDSTVAPYSVATIRLER